LERQSEHEPSTFSLEGCDTPKPSGESAQLTEGEDARAAHTTAVDAHLEALLAAWPQLSEELRVFNEELREIEYGIQFGL